MQTRIHRVRDVRDLGAQSFVLEVEGPFPHVGGGQFCMLSTPADWPVLLPRPFSYFDVEPDRATLLGKAIGPGTSTLRAFEAGAELRVTGPLGRSWPQVAAAAPVCLAGGVGLAPFLLWCKQMPADAPPIDLLYGGATASAIVATEDFPADRQRFHIATDDGSRGFRGTVLELYHELVRKGGIDAEAPVFCCGPDPMMAAVAADCARRGVRCWVSLETYMACGYGVCNGCSVAVVSAGRFRGKTYAKTCVAGPVFDASELEW